ncbi:MAG: hypothetical protein J0I41_03495 [Filimonas sp.]|nr:hypothetical protein [Filimonas sp.]
MKSRLLFLTILCICSTTLALSQDSLHTKKSSHKHVKPTPPWYVERFRVSAGAFFPINNTQIEVGNQAGTFGTTIDLEDDLGFKKNTSTFLGDAQWRASRRSRFDLSYYHIDRNSTHTLQRDIEFKDHTYPVNATIDAFFNTDIYKFTYGYALLSNPKYELGLTIGAHIVKASVGIGFNGATTSLNYSDDFGFTAPLPDLGIWGGYVIAPKWAINAEASYLSVTIDNITGRIVSYNAMVLYNPIRHLSFSAGYTGLNFKVNASKNNAQGYFKWGYNGPSIAASYSFGKKPW